MAVGVVGAVADDEVDDFAAGGFEAADGLAFGDAAGGADFDVAAWHFGEPVADGLAAVDGFLDADDDAAGDVAEVAGLDFPGGADVGGSGFGFADVPGDAAGADGGSGGAEFFGDVGFEDADAEAAVEDGLFFEDEFEVVFHAVLDGLHAFGDAGVPVFGDVVADAADDVVGVVDAVAGDFFDDVHALFAVAPGVVEEGVPADFVAGDAEPEDVAVDAVEFVDDGADVEAAFGDVEVEEFFDDLDVAGGVGLAADAADAFGEVDVLDVAAAFEGFFDAAVDVADADGDVGDDFTVECECEVFRFLEGRVLGAEGDG